MTASYQATIDGFLKKGYSLAQAEKFITDSVAIAVKARDRFWQDPDNRKGRPYPLIVAAVGLTALIWPMAANIVEIMTSRNRN